MQSTNEKQQLIKLAYIILLGCLGFLMLPMHFKIIDVSRNTIELLTFLNWLIITTFLIKTLPKGVWSISFIFFFAFSMFHGGLIFVFAFDLVTDQYILYTTSFWYKKQETDIAIYLVNYTMVIYAITVLLLSKKAPDVAEKMNMIQVKRLHHIGGAMLVTMIALFFLIGLSTGALQSYGTYLDVVKSTPLITLLFVYIYLFIGIALVFVAVSYRAGFGYTYFIIFAIWGAIAFKVGLRGEVMFPCAVAGAMLGRRRIPISNTKLLIAIVLMLFATIIVKNARVSGNYSAIDNLNPLNAIAELGSSLRAVQEVISWRQTDFELLNGQSYWAPIERQLALFLPIERPPALQDKRLLNVVVMERAGPIGFSPVAEAYANFGEKGVILIAIILGALFAKLDKVSSLIRTDILIGVAIIPLFIMIRNSFTFIPVQIFIGAVLALIILQLSKIKLET